MLCHGIRWKGSEGSRCRHQEWQRTSHQEEKEPGSSQGAAMARTAASCGEGKCKCAHSTFLHLEGSDEKALSCIWLHYGSFFELYPKHEKVKKAWMRPATRQGTRTPKPASPDQPPHLVWFSEGPPSRRPVFHGHA